MIYFCLTSFSRYKRRTKKADYWRVEVKMRQQNGSEGPFEEGEGLASYSSCHTFQLEPIPSFAVGGGWIVGGHLPTVSLFLTRPPPPPFPPPPPPPPPPPSRLFFSIIPESRTSLVYNVSGNVKMDSNASDIIIGILLSLMNVMVWVHFHWFSALNLCVFIIS